MSYQLVSASNQFLEASSNMGITDYPLTVSMAIKLTTDINMCLFWLGNSAATTSWISALAVDATANTFYAQSRNTSATALASSTTDPATLLGQWAHIAGVFTAADSRAFYLNGGTAEGTNAESQAAPTLNRVSIGHFGDSTPSQPANAAVAYCAVWDSALDETNVGLVHAGADPRTIDALNLVELWDFSSLNPRVGLVGGVTLTANNGPVIVADNPDLEWLANASTGRASTVGWPWHFYGTG